MSEMGQSRHVDRAPFTSAVTRLADILRVNWHASNVPKADANDIDSGTNALCRTLENSPSKVAAAGQPESGATQHDAGSCST